MFKLTTVTIAQYPSGEGLKFTARPAVGEPNGEQVVIERRGKLYFALADEAEALKRFGFRTPKTELLEEYRLWPITLEIPVDGFVHKIEHLAALRELWGQLNFRIERALSN